MAPIKLLADRFSALGKLYEHYLKGGKFQIHWPARLALPADARATHHELHFCILDPQHLSESAQHA